MSHWSEKYIGRPYIEGQYDCAELAIEVARNEFGLNVELLTERAIGLRAQSEQINACQADFADPTDDPKDGDPVLMISRGRFSHIGVLSIIDGERWILHAMKNAGMVVLHQERNLKNINLEIEGYYTWKV